MATLIRYRLDRAYESIEEAKLLLQNGHYHTAVNRLYYACFYAVSGRFVYLPLNTGFRFSRNARRPSM